MIFLSTFTTVAKKETNYLSMLDYINTRNQLVNIILT